MEKRIYQIAKELNISHLQILKFLESKSIDVPNHMAFVNNDIYDSILLEFSKEKKQVERTKKEKARQAINIQQDVHVKPTIEIKKIPVIPDVVDKSDVAKEDITEKVPV